MSSVSYRNLSASHLQETKTLSLVNGWGDPEFLQLQLQLLISSWHLLWFISPMVRPLLSLQSLLVFPSSPMTWPSTTPYSHQDGQSFSNPAKTTKTVMNSHSMSESSYMVPENILHVVTKVRPCTMTISSYRLSRILATPTLSLPLPLHGR